MIDKDLTSSVLATDVGAALLVILTAVPQVYVKYGTPEQRALGAVTLEEIERLHAEGHFPPGSMGPKIEAVIRFLRSGGRRALITNPESLPQAIDGPGRHALRRAGSRRPCHNPPPWTTPSLCAGASSGRPASTGW